MVNMNGLVKQLKCLNLNCLNKEDFNRILEQIREKLIENKAKELIEITGYTFNNEFSLSMKIALAIYSKMEKFNDVSWTLGTVYQAGKIEGIRQERAKKLKKKKLNSWLGGDL